MPIRDDIPKTDPSEIEALIERVKRSGIEPRDAQLIERLLRLILSMASTRTLRSSGSSGWFSALVRTLERMPGLRPKSQPPTSPPNRVPIFRLRPIPAALNPALPIRSRNVRGTGERRHLPARARGLSSAGIHRSRLAIIARIRIVAAISTAWSRRPSSFN
jgi:hypothetical protein